MTRISHNSTQWIAEDRCRLLERYFVLGEISRSLSRIPLELQSQSPLHLRIKNDAPKTGALRVDSAIVHGGTNRWGHPNRYPSAPGIRCSMWPEWWSKAGALPVAESPYHQDGKVYRINRLIRLILRDGPFIMQTTVELPEAVLHQLEMLASREGATPSDLIRRFVEERVAQN